MVGSSRNAVLERLRRTVDKSGTLLHESFVDKDLERLLVGPRR